MSISESQIQTQSIEDYFVRRSDLDDIETLNALIDEETKINIDLLYNYPVILSQFQTSFISLTILNSDQKIVGCACFNDTPPGLKGKYDNKHQNLWEQWLPQAFKLQGLPITSYNSLWVSFVLIDCKERDHVEDITERLLQNLYILLPQLDGVLFLKRGQVEDLENIQDAYRILKNHFFEFKSMNKQILKGLIGINYQSQVFYSPKSHVNQKLEIRMAREEDHDDLAEIFNKQSEVLTSQFGEFFIADLIATQNLTRRMNKGSKSQGRAIVGQVRDKAVGLMSVSTEIDYRLLNKQFQLTIYNNLIKEDLLDAINNRYQKIKYDQIIKKAQSQETLIKLIEEQRAKCLKIGQRIVLQHFCAEKQSQIKLQLENISGNENIAKDLNISGFWDLLNKWMTGFQIYMPSQIFQKYPQYAKDLQSFIFSPSEFLIQTLELFGLPLHYMKGQGHWKDWAEKIQLSIKALQLRRPKKQAKKPVTKKKGGKDDRRQDQQKPPSHFDVEPFKLAFIKFISVGAQVRTIFRQQIKQKQKSVVMLFCDENGQMINDKTVDLNSLGKQMNEHGVNVSPSMSQNMSSALEAFGGIIYNEVVEQIQVKEEQKKNIQLKKQVQTKTVKVTRHLISYADFSSAISEIAKFDIQLCRLNYINSNKLQAEIKELNELQDAAKAKRIAANARQFHYGQYESLVANLKIGQFPEIPYQCDNAIVISLFCIDEVFQSRSLQFVQYAFTLFPERDYIIITQPFTVPENTLVQNFIQVPKKKNSTFQHCLYIFHKDTLFAKQIQVRRSQTNDIFKGQYLLSEMLNKQQIEKQIKDSVLNPSSKYYSFSVTCGSQLIGIYTISKVVNFDYYISHFFVQDQIIVEEHSREKHGKVIYSFINPLFIKSVRFILKEIMRLTNKTCLYFQVHNRTLLPDIFHQFTPLRLRIFPQLLKRKWNFEFQAQDIQRLRVNKGGIDLDRNPYDQEQAPFSLSMLTKKDLSEVKVSNNTRIVVVGASDTGMSFIQSLLTIKQVNFSHITLLSPGGIITMHVNSQKDFLKASSTNYTLDEIKNLMIDARTTVLDAKMVKLDKKNKRIQIDKNAYVPYDLLVISVGLIDSLLQNQGYISYGLAESPYYKDKKYISGVYSIDDPYLYKNFAIDSKNIGLLKRKKKPQNITIYGRTPHTIAFISGLLARGVAPQRIFYVCPGSNRPRQNSFESNQERIQYQSTIINDPDTFEDPYVEKTVIEQLRHIGVNVELGFQFYGIEGNPCQSVNFRKKADDYEDLEQQIKNKKLQIQMKQQEMGNKVEEVQQDSDQAEEKISPQKEIQLLEQRQWKELITPSSFFITSGLVDIDKEIFNIIHQNGLVYNGRLIVKSNFQTTENQIFACGRICQFSQRYKNFAIGKSLRLDRYNGRQIGAILSKHVLDILNLSYLTTEKYTEDELPKFHMGVGIGSALPNNMVYYHIKKTQYSLPKVVLDKNFKSQELISKNIKDFNGHYIKFRIDPNNMIQSVSYLGSQQVIVPSLMSFIGLSAEYLNKLGKRNDHGLIIDIVQFLSENWAICLYHELFSEFRHYIKKLILSNPVTERLNNRAEQKASEGYYAQPEFMKQIKQLIPKQIVQQIRTGTINFIQKNKNHLPVYYTPRT